MLPNDTKSDYSILIDFENSYTVTREKLLESSCYVIRLMYPEVHGRYDLYDNEGFVDVDITDTIKIGNNSGFKAKKAYNKCPETDNYVINQL